MFFTTQLAPKQFSITTKMARRWFVTGLRSIAKSLGP